MTSYTIKGDFFEACDCEVICSCWVEQDPVMGQCTGLFIWSISAGTVAGVSVNGCTLATIAHGASCDDADQLLVLIGSDDAAARGPKYNALAAAFLDPTGPWCRVFNFPKGADLTAVKVEPAAFTRTPNGRNVVWTITALGSPQATLARVNAYFDNYTLDAVAAPPGGLMDRVTGSAGSIASVGVSRVAMPPAADGSDFGLDILADGAETVGGAPYRFDLDVTSVTAMRGTFAYANP